MRDRAIVNQERIQALVLDAITVLREVLQDKRASPSVRLRAAQTVFNGSRGHQNSNPPGPPRP